jgi:hypothetical protein
MAQAAQQLVQMELWIKLHHLEEYAKHAHTHVTIVLYRLLIASVARKLTLPYIWQMAHVFQVVLARMELMRTSPL